ncbi:hypothetical protein ACU635_43840 [[Actinomadura] parvosata]|uniref:hypothetical protein n=1 Tax=[Actinomadura] parvosata TaxID=1955412 RepID=UPI00406C9AC4
MTSNPHTPDRAITRAADLALVVVTAEPGCDDASIARDLLTAMVGPELADLYLTETRAVLAEQQGA